MKVAAMFCALALGTFPGGDTWSAESGSVNVRSYLLPFWRGPALKDVPFEQVAERDPRIRGVDGHPCGGMVVARVGRVPKADDAMLGTDAIIEIDSSGRVLREWRVPIDGEPYAIDGSRIKVWVHGDAYWFGLDRSITISSEPESTPPVGAECPRNDSGIRGEYGCTTLRDRTSGKDRIVVSHFVCT